VTRLTHGLMSVRAAVLCLLALLTCAVALGDPAAKELSETGKVSLDGLDLSKPEDARIARERIAKTAQHLCWKLTNWTEVSAQATYFRCVEETLARVENSLSPSTRIALRK
jgi:UrcA family protein